MPAEYHELHGNHENANLALGGLQDSNNMTANMYRVGDYVYFETSSGSPYQIRRIEELNKTPNGNVEAKVMCFFRRRDLPQTLIMLADKHQWMDESLSSNNGSASSAGAASNGSSIGNNGSTSTGFGELTAKQRHQMKHRELFLSRQVETMPATHIRGKCCVTLLNETESFLSYLNKDDTFFYCLVFDPAQRTLLADKGEIRVGSRYQADNISSAPLTLAERETDRQDSKELETLIWTPRHSLTDRQIDTFLVISRSVGTFARALDCSSSVKQPSLHMSAAAASRDITLYNAMDTLHRLNYDIAEAMNSLVPNSGPVLCRDEMEEWSASEANLFEEALEKYGKEFSDIRNDFLPWKSLKNVIEYYYMWKTTDRYVQQKRVKAVEAESKLKQVYIPNYNNKAGASVQPTSGGGIIGQSTIIPIPNTNNPANGKQTSVSIINGSSNGDSALLLGGNNGKTCEGCQTSQSPQWYAWSTTAQVQCRLCQTCWSYWKKYGGLKVPSRMDEIDACERNRATTGPGSDDEGKSPGSGGPQRPHRCSVSTCGKEFKLKAHLSRHYASAHGMDFRAGNTVATASGGQSAGIGSHSAGIGTELELLKRNPELTIIPCNVNAGSPRPVMKTRSAFYLRTSALARAARRICANQIRSRHAARAPHQPINAAPLRHICSSPEFARQSPAELRVLARATRPRLRPRVADIASRLGNHPQPSQPGEWDWLQLTAPGQRKQPEHVSFPRPPKAPDGSLLYERVPNKSDIDGINVTPPIPPTLQVQPNLKRPRPQFDELNGTDGIMPITLPLSGPPPSKRPHHTTSRDVLPSPSGSVVNNSTGPSHSMPLNGRPHALQNVPMSRSNARKQVMSWMDAPDDLYFRATDQTKKARRNLSLIELRRAARKPWRKLANPQRTARPDDMVVILD
ncbi:hypothetical protein TKK_0009931 [Trichogramma kaykai]|uniref:Metastasis-associated protein MTA3 n=1 Tax=Trichogramma kaykai TaxID=54128 RepID=A0ABD2WY90_9HYME